MSTESSSSAPADPAANNAAPTASTPDFLTKDEARSLIASIVRSSLQSTLPQALAAVVKPALDTELSPLRQQLEALAQPAPTHVEEKRAKSEPADAKPDPKVLELEKQIQALLAENKRNSERAAAERKRSVELAAYGELRSALNGKIRPETADAVEAIFRGRNLIAYDEDGNATVKMKIRPAKDMPEEEHDLPIAEAVSHWLKTKEASVFVPPQTQPTQKRPAPAPRAGNGQFANQPTDDPRAALEAKYGHLGSLIT